ncbi:hypothetical protein EQG41_07585 [Billgrantia azerbaijanica]|nr:hypothetical protein EQG41_07585 [Halomonas azerbaijanica]
MPRLPVALSSLGWAHGNNTADALVHLLASVSRAFAVRTDAIRSPKRTTLSDLDSMRFHGLILTSLALEGLEKHQRLIESYQKLHAARAARTGNATSQPSLSPPSPSAPIPAACLDGEGSSGRGGWVAESLSAAVLTPDTLQGTFKG